MGAFLFIGFAVLYGIWAWGQFPFKVILTLAGPMFLVGVLFLLNWRYRARR